MSSASSSNQLAPWVLICGGFHTLGGMDRANLALAETLVGQGRRVFLVGHQIEPNLANHQLVTATMVARPFNSILLGERALRSTGRRIASEVTSKWPDARVLVNGGNCDWPDINWVHSVHHAWPRLDEGAPLWFRAKSTVNKLKARHDERRALREAKLVITNSERTRRDVIALGVASEQLQVKYLGSDTSWKPATETEKHNARRSLGLPSDASVVSFVGALGYDRNKGFDTLLAAWQQAQIINSYLLVAGGGRGFEYWEARARESGKADRIRLLGFTSRVSEVYAASDLLVSPVRYEAFGLNVQEAICRGIPSIVSESAGVAELYPPSLRRYLLPDREDSKSLAALLSSTLLNLDSARNEFAPLADQIRRRTWRCMAEEIITLAESRQIVHT